MKITTKAISAKIEPSVRIWNCIIFVIYFLLSFCLSIISLSLSLWKWCTRILWLSNSKFLKKQQPIFSRRDLFVTFNFGVNWLFFNYFLASFKWSIILVSKDKINYSYCRPWIVPYCTTTLIRYRKTFCNQIFINLIAYSD